MDARRPRRRSPAIVACRGGCRESLNKGQFSRSASSFCSAWQKISSSFLHFHHLMAPLFLFLPFLFSYSFLLLLGFYLDFLILVFVLVRIMVDLIACAVDLLLFFTGVNLCGLICWFLLWHFLLKQLWASSLWVPIVYDVGCVVGFLLNLSILHFYPLAPLSSMSLGHRYWSSTMPLGEASLP